MRPRTDKPSIEMLRLVPIDERFKRRMECQLLVIYPKQWQFQPSWGAIAAALRARSLDLRRELAARVLSCFSRLLLNLSIRLPMKISFQYFYQICHAVPGFIANKAFSVLLQPVYNKYPRIVSTRQGKSNELFGEIEYELTFPIYTLKQHNFLRTTQIILQTFT